MGTQKILMYLQPTLACTFYTTLELIKREPVQQSTLQEGEFRHAKNYFGVPTTIHTGGWTHIRATTYNQIKRDLVKLSSVNTVTSLSFYYNGLRLEALAFA